MRVLDDSITLELRHVVRLCFVRCDDDELPPRAVNVGSV